MENQLVLKWKEEAEDEGSSDFQCPKEKRAIFKFRYGTEPKREPSDFNFDFEAFDFDHKNLRGDKQAVVKKDKIEENTLLLIKPSALIYKNQIRKRIYDEGFIILKEKTLRLKKESMSDFYDEHYGKPWFPKFIMKMISGPVHIMVLAKYNAIDDLKALLGNKRVSIARREAPYSLRALYGLKGDQATNGVHGSADRTSAAREIRFFFPQTILEPITDIPQNIDYLQDFMYDSVVQVAVEVNKEKPVNPLVWMGDWFLQNNNKSPVMEPEYLMKANI